MKPFHGIMIDPPWPERGGGKIKRGADRHYTVIKKREDILEVILAADQWNPAEDCHLYLWSTNNYLPWALWLIKELGFRYITNFPWTKTGAAGLGQYARGKHELLLFGVRGQGFKACTVHPETGKRVKNIDTARLVQVHRVRDPDTGKVVHSAKPPEARQLVEDRTIGPYLEMFARGQAPKGWTFWGDQAL